jgi:NAD(P)-dependent dehydrogenase (short-subunit alcohol dehydrogenase family)
VLQNWNKPSLKRRQQVLLEGKVAVITGGAVGIGRGIALKFAEEGCSILVADISEAEGRKTAEEVSVKGRESLFVKCNVTITSQVKDLMAAALRKFGQVDILVNNAGGVPRVIRGGSIADVTDEQWESFINLNLKSAFLCCREIVPHMMKRRSGNIVNLSSIGAVQPSDSVIAYHCAKAGVVGLTCNLAFDLAPYNVRVNSIMPGPIKTPFWNPVLKDIPDKEAFFKELAVRNIPLRRIGTPEDIAGTALFLASELSAYVTGENICVAGGVPLLPHELHKDE